MSPKRKRFLSPEKLDEAHAQIAVLAAAEGVPVALIGGYALQFYGSPRLTGDLDVTANAFIQSLRPKKSLSFGGVQTKAPNGVPVDWVIRRDGYAALYKDALRRAVRIRGAPTPVARPEHLAAMKMVAGRDRDIADLEFLITHGINLTATRKIISRFLGLYAVDEFDRIVEEAKWKASMGRT